MSYGNYVPTTGYKLFAKTSNYGSVANFSSTIDDAHLLLVANNCNNVFYNDQHNAAVIGATSTIINDNPYYETYIGIKTAGNTEKIALFDSDEIKLKKNTIITGDLLPSSNEIYNLGNSNYRWKDLYLSGNTINMVNVNGEVQSISAGASGFEMKDTNNNPIPVVVKNLSIPSSEEGKYFNLGVSETGETEVKTVEIPAPVEGQEPQPPIVRETISLSRMNTNTMVEGSNLFFTHERSGWISYSSNQETSNYASRLNEENMDYTSNLISTTSNLISTRISELTGDEIADGLSHRFIVNNIYDTELTVKGTITASNLTVLGETTVIETVEYTAEKLHIIHDDYEGPALRIDHHTDITDEVFSTWKYESGGSSNLLMMVKSDNNKPKIGIGTSEPSHTLDIVGDVHSTGIIHGESDLNISNIQTLGNIYTNDISSSNIVATDDITATNFIGSGEQLHSVNFLDRNTDLLTEGLGSNFYYTEERRINMSNYIGEVRDELWEQVGNRTLDSMYQGTSNKYVVNNIYDGDLYVAGKLMVTGIDIVDMDYIVAQEGSTASFGNVFGLISDVTSNLVTLEVSHTSNNLIEYINNSVSDTAFWNYELSSNVNNVILTDAFSVENLPFKHIVDEGNLDSNQYRRIYDLSVISQPENTLDNDSISLFSGIINVTYNKTDENGYSIVLPITTTVLYSYFPLIDFTINNNTITLVDTISVEGVTETIFEITFDDAGIAGTYGNNNINIDKLNGETKLSLIAR